LFFCDKTTLFAQSIGHTVLCIAKADVETIALFEAYLYTSN